MPKFASVQSRDKAIRAPRRLAQLLLASTALVTISASAALAAEAWLGTVYTDWSNPANWVSAVPVNTDLVQIDGTFSSIAPAIGSGVIAQANIITIAFTTAGSLYIQPGGALNANNMTVASAGGFAGLFNVTGDINSAATATITNTLRIGTNGNGFSNILSGGQVSANDIFIGELTGGTGTVTVDGTNSLLNATNQMIVGGQGTGILNITNSAHAGADTASGEVIVGGGASGTGTINVNSGALLQGFNLTVGGASGAQGTVDVDAATATITNNTYVGSIGTGFFHVSNGGLFSSDALYVGYNGGTGTMTVDGMTSSATITDTFIANSGGGSLSIINGASFATGSTGGIGVGIQSGTDGLLTIASGGGATSGAGVLGSMSGSFGAASVDGAGSTWTLTSGLVIGDAGGGTLSVLNGGVVTNSGAVSGAGVQATGNGTVLISGANSAFNNTNASSIFGIGVDGTGVTTVANDGALSANSIQIALNSGSSGTLNIGADSSSSAAAAGDVTAPTINFGSGFGAVVFNHTETNYSFASQFTNALANTASISQMSGHTILTGNSSSFSGTTTVSGGTLSVNGSLGGTINVTGGSLGGSGTIGSTTIGSGGDLAPGNSIGTLAVSSVTFDPGSTYTVELNDAGNTAGINNDLLSATGTVTINGGTVHVTPVNGTDNGLSYFATSYMIVTAAGGVTGTFDGVTDDYAYLSFGLSYDANNVYLNSTMSNFCLPGMTANQCATGSAVQSIGSGSLYAAVSGLSTAEAATASDMLSGEIHASAKSALIEDSRFLREAALGRIRQVFALKGDTQGTGVWVQGFGAYAHTNGDGNAAALSHATGGIFAGADGSPVENWTFGMLAGLSHTGFDADGRSSSGSATSYHLGAYGGTQWDAFGLRFGGAYTWHSIDVDRTVAFTGFADSLSSDYQAGTGQVFAEFGYRTDIERSQFEPFANVAWVSHTTDGFSESGGAAALTGRGDTMDTAFTTIGLRGATELAMGGNAVTQLTGMVGWRHAFEDITPTSTHAFAGSTPFTISGVPIAEDALVLEAGLEGSISPETTFGVRYSGQIGSGISDHAIKADLASKF